MLPLYPDIKPYAQSYLAVEPPHELYIEESGNPQGIPILYVHGGPGDSLHSKDRCFFNPKYYRIILFDQRGAGRSTPHASLTHNTTQALISDIEAIRQSLAIDRWLLFGGSWGSTLSLVYAQQYPERVMGLILRGIFLCRDQDINWLFRRGASCIFPDYWIDFMQPLADEAYDDTVSAYYQLLTGDNELIRMSAAKAWSIWAARCATLHPHLEIIEQAKDPRFAMALARVCAHYMVNKGFLKPNQIIIDAPKLAGIFGIIVHGRYDMVCTLDNATTLHQAWPDSQLQIIRDAGHARSEPGIIDALVHATDAMARRFS